MSTSNTSDNTNHSSPLTHTISARSIPSAILLRLSAAPWLSVGGAALLCSLAGVAAWRYHSARSDSAAWGAFLKQLATDTDAAGGPVKRKKKKAAGTEAGEAKEEGECSTGSQLCNG